MAISSLGGSMVMTSDRGVFGPSLPCDKKRVDAFKYRCCITNKLNVLEIRQTYKLFNLEM